MAHDFTVIVPVRNGGPRWIAAAKALAAAVPSPARVVVIDSESSDGSDVAAAQLGFTVERITAASFSHGGTREAAVERHGRDRPFVVLLTHDAVLDDSGAIEVLLESFSDPQVGCAFGRQLPHADADPFARHFVAFNYPPVSATRSLADAATLGIKAAYFSNSFAAYRVSDLRAAGGFPAHLIVGEDAHVAMRVLLAGRKVRYCAAARVRHSHNYRWLDDMRRYFDFGVMHSQIPELLTRFGNPEGEGLRLVASELAFLARQHPLLAATVPWREGMKYLGYRLGRAHASLPRALKTRLSMTRGFWRAPSAAPSLPPRRLSSAGSSPGPAAGALVPAAALRDSPARDRTPSPASRAEGAWSIGPFIRRMLGPRLFPAVGARYRALFVHLGKVVDHLPELRDVRHVLDIGGGDGAVLDVILGRQRTVRATLLDVAANVGWAIRPELLPRVTLLPATTLRAYIDSDRELPDLVVVSDVLHHIPAVQRLAFLRDVGRVLNGHPATIAIKDVEQGHWRATLGYWSDRYVTGDRNVRLIGVEELLGLAAEAFPGAVIERTGLGQADPPNYSILVRVPAAPP